MNEIAKLNSSVDTFGYPLSNIGCKVCRGKMHDVAFVNKVFGSLVYGFRGYKCFRCGHEDIVHEEGGVLGNGKKQVGIRESNIK